MERHFEHELTHLKEHLLWMGGRAEAILAAAMTALDHRDADAAHRVFADDKVIDRMEIEIEEQCVRLLALQQPLARDLRFITASLKISNDLERVGDHAVNIAGSALRLSKMPVAPIRSDLRRLASLSCNMLRESLDTFVHRDAERARRLVLQDDEVDAQNREVYRFLVGSMMENPTTIARELELILVARNLERVADLATNVAEEVVYIAEARIIKHHSEQ